MVFDSGLVLLLNCQGSASRASKVFASIFRENNEFIEVKRLVTLSLLVNERASGIRRLYCVLLGIGGDLVLLTGHFLVKPLLIPRILLARVRFVQ
jgi:hypothetical protein